jgi:dienelactone hydrolase
MGITAAPRVLENGVTGVSLTVVSANPDTFYQAISEPERMPAAELDAELFLPSGPGPWPAVIVVPGSLGIAPSHVTKARLLTDSGIAAMLLDPFGRRGVSSTVANQAQYSFAASAWDVLAAARTLAEHPAVEADRIGAQGHSRGGSAVLSAACLPRLIASARPLKAVYAAYPWCGQQFSRPLVGPTRVRAVIGDRDEWCLAQQVQGYLHAMRLCGGDASFRLFGGAHHSFDRDTPLELVADASVAPGAPTVFIEDDGCVHPLTGEPSATISERELMLYGIKAGYGRRGATIGSEGDQASRFHEDMLAFWATL